MYVAAAFSALLFLAVVVHGTVDGILWSKKPFNSKGYSWDPEENQGICARQTVHLPLAKNKTDYAESMSKALLDLSRSGGGTLLLDEGEYPLRLPVELLARTCITGAGMKKTVLRVVNASLPFSEKTGAIYAANATLVTLQHFSVDGNGKGQGTGPQDYHGRNGIFLERASNVLIQGVQVSNNLIHGGKYCHD